ncbi:hypothetical protein SLA2020_504750 [Shorea laevis]
MLPLLPPGPKPRPVIGNLLEMLINKPTYRWIHNLMHDMNKEIACIWLGNIPVVAVTCPEIARLFLRDHDADFASRPVCMTGELISKGYSTTTLQPFEDRWKDMRKIIRSHVVSQAKHQWFEKKRMEEADNLVRYVYNQCGGFGKTGLVNIRTAAQHYCGNVIRKISFNKRYFREEREDRGPGVAEEEHVNALFTNLTYAYPFCVADYVPWLRRFDLDGVEKIIREANEIVEKYHNPIIEERIQQWKNGTKEEENDLLDVFINLKDDGGNPLLSEIQIKAQITELMIATVDNPSNAFEWTLAEMLNQPEILEKAIEELDRVVGKDRLVQESDISNLNYIKACARETFRLHSVAPFNVPHVSTNDKIVAGYFIPKGSRLFISRIALGRSPKVWDEPTKYKPERHLKDDGSEVVLTETDLRFISFSIGRRGCPAITLGTSITIMLFARLLQGFSWSLPSNQSKIDLANADDLLLLAKPLVAMAKPRLPENLYPIN